MNEYKVDDFEAVKEIEPVDGCKLCWFYQMRGHNFRCQVVVFKVGAMLEQKFGHCEDGHHYTLKNGADKASELHAHDRYAVADQIINNNKQ